MPSEALTLGAPVPGAVVPLAVAREELFASGNMGEGIAVNPGDGKDYAPVAGTVIVAMPHVSGIVTDAGLYSVVVPEGPSDVREADLVSGPVR